MESVRSGEQALRLAREGDYDLIIADVTDGRRVRPSRLPYALLDACPEVRGRLVVACSGEERAAGSTWLDQPLRRVRKPFNLRDLKMVAEGNLSVAGRSWPASRAAR